MKLIGNKDSKYVVFPHVIQGLEGIYVQFLSYPQSDIPKIPVFRWIEIQSIIEYEAKARNMHISH